MQVSTIPAPGLSAKLIPYLLEDMVYLTVLDVGANTGQFALEIHKILPQAMIYSFEPLKDCYEQLMHNMTCQVLADYRLRKSPGRRFGGYNLVDMA